MVKLLGLNYFDVILLDINMAGMGGFEASKIIR
jgi:CheY-like chemotaxis protein